MKPEQRLALSLELRRAVLGEGDATGRRLAPVLTRAKLPQP
jgi:hypothetical protein